MWHPLAAATARFAYILSAAAFMSSQASKRADVYVPNVKKNKKVQ